MIFKGVKAITIPEGSVAKITAGGAVLWEAPSKNKWNLLERTEFRGIREQATFYFNPATAHHRMQLSEDVWVNGGRRYQSNISYYSNHNGGNAAYMSSLSNITENGFTLTSGSAATDLVVAFPFHLKAGETITITHTRSGHNRSGYQIFNVDGTCRSYTKKDLTNSPGAGDTTTFTAPDECWFFWLCGRYDKSTSVTISNIVVTIE